MNTIWIKRDFHSNPKFNRELNRFFELTLATKDYVIPSECIDKFVHGMIDDGSFERLQADIGSKLIHDSSISGERLQTLYGKSYDAYIRYFGEAPPEEFWADPAGCGMNISKDENAGIPAGCGYVQAQGGPDIRPAGCGVVAA